VPDSLHEQLQQAALERVKLLDLPLIGQNVVRIKMPEESRIQNLDLPACVLMTFGEQEEYPNTGTNARDDTTFPIHVVLLSNDLTSGDDAWPTLCRQMIRRAFRSQRLAVTGHYTTEIGPGPVVDIAVEGRKLQGSSMTLRLRCWERRGIGV
jgi:hypothetical protein